MFYLASYESGSKGHDPYLLRFLGRGGIQRALCDKPAWLD